MNTLTSTELINCLFIDDVALILLLCSDFPGESDTFISFRCDRQSRWIYPLASLVLGMKALAVAKETYIRINSDGIMCIQHQLESHRGQDMFIDFLMLSEDDPGNYNDTNNEEE